MPHSLALISDLHGNAVSLRAVFDDIARRGIEHVICLGDVATLGPKPRQVIAMLREARCPCILGNHDAFLLDSELIHSYTEVPVVVEAVEWCRAQLTEPDLEFLRTFHSTLELDLDGVPVFLYHGSPRSHMQELLSDSPVELLEETLAGTHARVYAGGHTHLQMVRSHRGKWLVNPGSVGIPFRDPVSNGPPVVLPHAEYASVEVTRGVVSVSLHQVPVDRQQLYNQASAAATNPITSMLLTAYQPG